MIKTNFTVIFFTRWAEWVSHLVEGNRMCDSPHESKPNVSSVCLFVCSLLWGMERIKPESDWPELMQSVCNICHSSFVAERKQWTDTYTTYKQKSMQKKQQQKPGLLIVEWRYTCMAASLRCTNTYKHTHTFPKQESRNPALAHGEGRKQREELNKNKHYHRQQLKETVYIHKHIRKPDWRPTIVCGQNNNNTAVWCTVTFQLLSGQHQASIAQTARVSCTCLPDHAHCKHLPPDKHTFHHIHTFPFHTMHSNFICKISVVLS